jgi:hypothetical protein
MTDNSDGWIKHEPGPCPIPDAKRWEWEYISISSAPMAVKDPDAHPAKYEKYWLDGSITHYRLHTPAQDKDALIQLNFDALTNASRALDSPTGMAPGITERHKTLLLAILAALFTAIVERERDDTANV